MGWSNVVLSEPRMRNLFLRGSRLLECFDNFLQIHESYQYYRLQLENSVAEANALDNEDSYVAEIQEQVDEAIYSSEISLCK